ncbi:MAG: MFS transporter [Candidatus Bipolaricaulia bacterium]
MAAKQRGSSRRPTGMLGFTFVWSGQILSVLASNATSFALTIWAYQTYGSATALGVVSTSFIIPFLLLSPIAGVLVDRHSRKMMMMVSDLVAVVATVGILAILGFGELQMWHLFVAAAIAGLGNTFQWPAYSAAITTMLPKEQYGRANGMMSLVDSGPAVFAPILAGALYPIFGLRGILIIDLCTFFLAIGALMVVHIPPPRRTAEGEAAKGSMLREALFGFRYIFERKCLLRLLLFFLALNFLFGLAYNVFDPFILERTANSSAHLGYVRSAAAIGGVVGGLLLSLWGGFKRRMRSVFLGEAMTGCAALVLFGVSRSLPMWILAAGIGALFFPLINGACQSIWQAKVAPDLQGRVFSARRMIAFAIGPITPVIAGVLADYVTEPAMTSVTWLSRTFGWLVGTSPGSGMALQFVLAGLLYFAIVVYVFLFVPSIRNVEDLLPDHDEMETVSAGDTG